MIGRDEADAGEGEDENLPLRAAPTTVNSSRDTSLDNIGARGCTSATNHPPPLNEILYLQILLSGETQVVRKPGVQPVVCYVDRCISTGEDAGSTAAGHLRGVESSMSKLDINGESLDA